MRPPRKAPAPSAGPARAPEAVPLKKTLLKAFFAVVAVGLFLSTLLGIWMGVTVSRWKVAAALAGRHRHDRADRVPAAALDAPARC